MRARVKALACAVVGCSGCLLVMDLDVDGYHAREEASGEGGVSALDGAAASDGAGPACVADTKTDKLHCGACGHSCLGGDCVDGKCAPRVLAKLPAGVAEAGMTSDDAHVYVALRTPGEGGTVAVIRRIDKVTGETLDVATRPGLLRAGIAVMGGQVFFWGGVPGGFELVSVETTGANQKVIIPLASAGTAGHMSASDNQILWVDTKSPARIAICRLGAFAGGLACNTFGTAVPNVVSPWDVVVHRDRFCATTADAKGTVFCCSLPTCSSVALLADSEESPLEVDFDDEAVYWLSLGETTAPAVRRCSLPSCTAPTTFAGNLTFPMELVLDATHVYWTESGGLGRPNQGSIQRCPKTGCGADSPVLVGGLTEPGPLTIDAKAVYWMDTTDGLRVMSLAK